MFTEHNFESLVLRVPHLLSNDDRTPLKEHADVTLAIYAGDDVTVARMLFSDHRKSVRIGPNLHLVTVTARRRSESPLVPGTLYYYNLSFTTDAGTVGLVAAVGASGKA